MKALWKKQHTKGGGGVIAIDPSKSVQDTQQATDRPTPMIKQEELPIQPVPVAEQPQQQQQQEHPVIKVIEEIFSKLEIN